MNLSLVVPGWPRDRYANGIVTAAHYLLDPLQAEGARVRALAWEGDPTDPAWDRRVGRIPETEGLKGPGRVIKSMRWKLDFEQTGRRQAAERVAGALATASAGSEGDVVETEDAHGWTNELRALSPVTIAVALHGPWFLHGPMEGASARDPRFVRRVRAEGRALAKADVLIAPSRDVLRRTQRYYGLSRTLAAIIPYAFPVAPRGRRWTRAGADPNHIAFIGRFDRHKGGDVAIDALACVARSLPAARMTFVGPDRGVDDEAGRHWSLQEYAERRLPGCLERGQLVIAGQLAGEEIHRVRMAAGVTISCSRWENLSLAAIEAMASGCPTIVANRGGLPEHVQHMRNGAVFESGSPQDLAEKLHALMADPALAERLGQNAAQYVESAFDPRGIARARLAAYQAAIARRRRAGDRWRP